MKTEEILNAGAELRFMCSKMLALTILRQPGGAGHEKQLENAIKEWDALFWPAVKARHAARKRRKP